MWRDGIYLWGINFWYFLTRRFRKNLIIQAPQQNTYGQLKFENCPFLIGTRFLWTSDRWFHFSLSLYLFIFSFVISYIGYLPVDLVFTRTRLIALLSIKRVVKRALRLTTALSGTKRALRCNPCVYKKIILDVRHYWHIQSFFGMKIEF